MRRDGRVLWRVREVAVENVGTPMFLVPNLPGKLGSWTATGERYASDFDFISGSVALQGEPVWQRAVIALAPPLPPLKQLRITFRSSRLKGLRDRVLGRGVFSRERFLGFWHGDTPSQREPRRDAAGAALQLGAPWVWYRARC